MKTPLHYFKNFHTGKLQKVLLRGSTQSTVDYLTLKLNRKIQAPHFGADFCLTLEISRKSGKISTWDFGRKNYTV